MKIAHFVIGGDVAGGQVVAAQLARAARARGDDAFFVSPTPGPFVDAMRAESFDVHLVPVRGTLDLRAVLRLRGLLRAQRATLLHTHGQIPTDVVGRLAARLARVPIVGHIHIENHLPPGRARRTLLQTIDNATVRLCSRIVAVSEDTRRAMLRHGYPKRVEVVHNGVPIPESQLDGDGDGVLEVARLAPVKGQRELLEAAAKLDGVHIMLVGRDLEDRGYEDTLRSAATDLGIADRVEFAGYRPDAGELMSNCAVFALPSWTEGLPMTVLEAMARGRAVVATAVGGTPEVVVHGETGLLVPPRDPDALATALGTLLRDPQLRSRFGDAARRRVAEHFSLDRMTGRVLALYDEVTRG